MLPKSIIWLFQASVMSVRSRIFIFVEIKGYLYFSASTIWRLKVAGTGLTKIADHQYVACLWGQIRGQKYRDYWILNGFESIKL